MNLEITPSATEVHEVEGRGMDGTNVGEFTAGRANEEQIQSTPPGLYP